jgi:hypothetical protein
MTEFNPINSSIVAAVYLLLIFLFVNIHRKVRHNIPRTAVIIFLVCLVITAVALYVLTPLLPQLFGLARERMGGVYMGIWAIVFFIIDEVLIRVYR